MKIIKSFLLVLIIATLTFGTTKAYFSDQAVSSGNTFSTGSLDLKLSDDDETVKDSVENSLSGNDMIPGGDPVSGLIELKNTGTIAGDHIEVQTTNNCSVSDMSQYLEIVALDYDGNSILDNLPDNNGNNYKDLDDLSGDDALDNLSLTDLNNNHPFSVSIRLYPDTPNIYQGQNCDSTFIFTLNQNASQ